MPPEISLQPHVCAYLGKRGTGDFSITGEVTSNGFSGAVVIPSLAEAANLPKTLASLSSNPAGLLERFLILVVVNQRGDAKAAEAADNLETLKMLPVWKQQYGLGNLHWVDAASVGRELPPGQGVGLARKIGLDLALRYLEYRDSDPRLVCLDADTLVQPDYLSAIVNHFSSTTAGGASIPYRHRPAADAAGQFAIDRYELFLRSYVLGLETAGSPYAFHTVGSAMASRVSAYVASGGMNRRLAGEDFYFLQQVHKTSGVTALSGTLVHPSPRPSYRVPFGTGRSVGDMLAKGEQRLLFYQPVVFSIIGGWLSFFEQNNGRTVEEIMGGAADISPVLHDFLMQTGFITSLENMKRNNRSNSALTTAFHGWFDAFRTMRLIHELSDRAYPRILPEQAVAPLLESAGHCVPDTLAGQLELLRGLQGASVRNS